MLSLLANFAFWSGIVSGLNKSGHDNLAMRFSRFCHRGTTFLTIRVAYFRQSYPKQVCENLQSQRLQYALHDNARTLGFRQLEIIDDDLGSRAALGARVREGFTQLLPLGEVGMALSMEVARLLQKNRQSNTYRASDDGKPIVFC